MTSSETNGSSDQPVVCVYCASSPGRNPQFTASARALGESLNAAAYKLVYGGGTQGIMGEIAKTMVSLSSPQNVEGIIPKALIQAEKDPSTRDDEPEVLDKNVKQAERTMKKGDLEQADGAHNIPLSEFGKTIVVDDMHTRKGLMVQKVRNGGPGSGFVALAGGYGTIEEVMEMVTWNQLGIHKLPVVLVNVNGYWDGLLQWVRNAVEEGFIGKGNADILTEVKDPKDVVDALKNYKVAEGRFKLNWNKQ